MAEKTAGTKNQDKLRNPQMNERPEEDQGDIRQREVQREIKESGAESAPTPVPNKTQENLQNRGLQEDQPKNPVRSTGSMASDQQEDTYRQPGDKFSEDADKISS